MPTTPPESPPVPAEERTPQTDALKTLTAQVATLRRQTLAQEHRLFPAIANFLASRRRLRDESAGGESHHADTDYLAEYREATLALVRTLVFGVTPRVAGLLAVVSLPVLCFQSYEIAKQTSILSAQAEQADLNNRLLLQANQRAAEEYRSAQTAKLIQVLYDEDRCADPSTTGRARTRVNREAAVALHGLGVRDFSDAPLCNTDLTGVSFPGVRLHHADLRSSRFDGADLSDAVLTDTRAHAASLQGARLRDANLVNGRLQFANLIDADLSRADLRGARLEHAGLSGANLEGALLSGADLTDAVLQSADLSGANLTGLVSAVLRRANLAMADLSDAAMDGCVLDGADLRLVRMRRASLRGVNLTSADLSRSDLEGADLSYANLSGANLSDAKLHAVRLQNTKCDEATVVDESAVRCSKGLLVAVAED